MKKILLLFAGAALSFLGLSYIDEYENLIKPLFGKVNTRISSATTPQEVKESAKKAIIDFNGILSKAYLSSDPSLLLQGKIDEKLRASFADEISFLVREGKVMEFNTKDVEVEKIVTVSPVAIQVISRETVLVRYLSFPDRHEEKAFPPVRYRMRYMLQAGGDGWKILSAETVGLEGQQ